MNKRYLLVVIALGLVCTAAYGQVEKTTKLTVINPGIAWERPLGLKTTTEIHLGIGYNGSYPELTAFGDGGVQFLIAPFADFQTRRYYNFEKRALKGRSTEGNTGNFIALRGLYTGQRITGNVLYDQNYAVAVGPTWGLQRKKGALNILFSMGPVYYFDFSGTANWLPLHLELNLGFHLKKKK